MYGLNHTSYYITKPQKINLRFLLFLAVGKTVL